MHFSITSGEGDDSNARFLILSTVLLHKKLLCSRRFKSELTSGLLAIETDSDSSKNTELKLKSPKFVTSHVSIP